MKKTLISLAILTSLIIQTNLNSSIEEIKLKVEDLSCGNCSTNLAKHLLNIPKVKAVHLNTNNNLITLVLEKDNRLNPAKLKHAIEKNTPYSIKDIKITATGYIIQEGNKLALDVQSIPSKIYLAEIVENKTEKTTPKNKIEPTSFGKKTTNTIKEISKKTWAKTKSIFNNIWSNKNKFEAKLQKYNNYKSIVRLSGSIKQEVNGEFWISSQNHVSLNDIDSEKVKTFVARN